jgi:hypothetical protein
MSEQDLTDILVERPELEFLLLADHAEAMNGKLYLMGGGWDRRAIADLRQTQTFAVALGVLIPWNDTNRPIPLAMTLRDVDGVDVVQPLQTQIVLGRPATATPGQKLRYMLAINYQLVFAHPGQYVVEARAGTGPAKRVSFFVDALPAPPAGPAGSR